MSDGIKVFISFFSLGITSDLKFVFEDLKFSNY